ncbi:MAG: hypothetical protein HQ568_01345 [Calditrichaeota bacterium]|nr:hypothetical protein [Calditrichota bacterium]
MKKLIIAAIIVVLTGVTSVYSSQLEHILPSGLLIELEDETAKLIRTDGYAPEFLDDLMVENPTLKPLFYVPKKSMNLELWYKHGLNRWFKVKWDSPETAEEIASMINKDNGVIKFEISKPYTAYRLPDDYENYDKWDLDAMHLPEAWDIQTGDSEVIISIIDTGCEILHPDIRANLWVNTAEDLNENGILDDR